MIETQDRFQGYDDRATEKKGYAASYYTGEGCSNCGRDRVMVCDNGKHVCEKCGWDQNKEEYSPYLSL